MNLKPCFFKYLSGLDLNKKEQKSSPTDKVNIIMPIFFIVIISTKLGKFHKQIETFVKVYK